MPEYSIVKTTDEHIKQVAATMRPKDMQEVWAVGRWSPEEGLRASVAATNHSFTGLADDVPICMFGIATEGVFDKVGLPWLLSTTALPLHSRKFARESKRIVGELRKEYPIMANMVDDRYTETKRWLEWLGFTLSDPFPVPPDGYLFRIFEMRT